MAWSMNSSRASSQLKNLDRFDQKQQKYKENCLKFNILEF